VSRRVVVTGIGMVTPLGLDTESTWQAMLEGRSGVGPITAFDPDGFETRIAAEVRGFDPARYMDRKDARRMDRFAQFALVASQEAVTQAGLDIARVGPERVAVVIGTGVGGILTLSEQFGVLHTRGPQRISPFFVPMMLADMASGQVSIHLGIKGPSLAVLSACASGSDAIGQAWEMVRRGTVEVALAGGTEAPICPIAVAGFNACQALSTRNEEPERASRPFDRDRDGFVIGEGSAVLVLEALEHALRRGARPLAELVGYGTSSDAYHITQPDPEGDGGALAIQRALESAGIRPEEVDYINAHGTSTPLNDRAETKAIKRVFGEWAYRVAISSTKSMTGHLLGAAGALEAAVCVLAVHRSAIPPTINLDNPDPECDLDYTPWRPRFRPVRVAMSNSFGFGGHNSCLVFQAWEG